ncbi:class I SAM-dependent methyltransferase [Nocardia alba]|uniref:Methyltransferase family protein n=1 Tax=Nocardia alba TaxID=225051 RepID=A0A4R1FTX6_9NOCA|nr:class I SAM-dependent methyltransferase [Nocardia alba]TCJ97232.1 methyltransferase family protein [Nocardia alba]
MTRRCRGCAKTTLTTVLDLGSVPAADHFPPRDTPVADTECGHPLRMDRCAACGLAQLADDDTVTAEPRGVEPRALRDQAAEAVGLVHAAGLLRGSTVTEFGSPHGGTWLPLLAEHGFTESTGGPSDVVLDCFGIMHEPDQRAAFAARAAATAPDGVLLVQYHSLATIVAQGQWNALRHGHFAYYSLSTLRTLLRAAGMSVVTAWEFDLYGGTVLLAVRHGDHTPDTVIDRLLAAEADALSSTAELQQTVDRHVHALRDWLETAVAQDLRVYAYGAASRAVALLSMAGAHRGLLAGVADASPGKQGCRMPGTDVAIISPAELVAAEPDVVLLTLPDLLAEVSAALPELDGRWVIDDPAGPRG